MNKFLERLLEDKVEPKIKTFSERDTAFYIAGMKILAAVVPEDFFDVDRGLGDIEYMFKCEGLFYELPYYDANTVYSSGKSVDLLYLHLIEKKSNGNKSMSCPLRITFMASQSGDYSLTVVWQSGEKSVKGVLYGREDGGYYTEIEGHNTLTLSKLLERMDCN